MRPILVVGVIVPSLTVAVCLGSSQAQVSPQLISRQVPKPSNWRDRRNGRIYPLPLAIGGRPVSFYLTNPNVSPLAKALYTARFRPSDNDSTARLLSLATTSDPVIRPFYRWCLDFTITLSDGALGEYTGEPALAYASRFPQEFFAYIDKDTSGQRYKSWVNAISYSGLPTSVGATPAAIRKAMASRLSKNCRQCNPLMTSRINALAADVARAASGNQ